MPALQGGFSISGAKYLDHQMRTHDAIFERVWQGAPSPRGAGMVLCDGIVACMQAHLELARRELSLWHLIKPVEDGKDGRSSPRQCGRVASAQV